MIQWLGEDEDHGDQRHRLNLELVGQIGLIVVGGGVDPEFVAGSSRSDSPMGQLMNALPKVVFSQQIRISTVERSVHRHMSGESTSRHGRTRSPANLPLAEPSAHSTTPGRMSSAPAAPTNRPAD